MKRALWLDVTYMSMDQVESLVEQGIIQTVEAQHDRWWAKVFEVDFDGDLLVLPPKFEI